MARFWGADSGFWVEVALVSGSEGAGAAAGRVGVSLWANLALSSKFSLCRANQSPQKRRKEVRADHSALCDSMKLPCPFSACAPSRYCAHHSSLLQPSLHLPLPPFTHTPWSQGLLEWNVFVLCLCARVCLALSVRACPWLLSVLCRSDLHLVPPRPADLYPLLDGGCSREHGARDTARARLGGQGRGQVGGRANQSCSVLPGDWEPQQPKTGDGGLILERHY